MPQTLVGPRLTLRPIRADDAPAIAALLVEPGVRKWWVNYDLARVEREIINCPDDDEAWYAIEIAGELAGVLDCYEENEPEFRHAGIDLLLGARWQGEGYGPEAIKLVARMLIDVRGHHRLVIDPARANQSAVKAYESVGFKSVGVMRQYTLSEEGEWIDGLMMDMLASELQD